MFKKAGCMNSPLEELQQNLRETYFIFLESFEVFLFHNTLFIMDEVDINKGLH